MRKLIAVFTLCMAFGLTASAQAADPTPLESVGGSPHVYQAINKIFTAAGYVAGVDAEHPDFASNVAANAFKITTANSYWEDVASGIPTSFIGISMTAANTNTVGVFPKGSPADFDPATDPSDAVLPPIGGMFGFLGSGTIADPFPSGDILLADGVDFGIGLRSVNGTDEKWYSDPSLNWDGIDHMLAYYLPNLAGVTFHTDTDNDGIADHTVTLTKDTYVFAFEDRARTHGGFDGDYNDYILLVSNIAPVSEPMSLLLMGGGLAGLAGARRRKRS